ncbi:MAG: UDP-N-acetylglucosamine 1-carboxyvinyltransferase [Patescibacteria group bacterium]
MTTDTFIIQGLAGQKKLKGTVRINGAKNAALKAMAAAILCDSPVLLENIPHNDDVETLAEILRKLGASVVWKDHQLEIDPRNIHSTSIDAELAQKMRASVVLTGPLLARFGKVTFPAPGGCVIGARPIDQFIAGYKKMGATVDEQENQQVISAAQLQGTEIFFDFQTVGGTETLMMAATLAEGTTVLKNCAMEPEIANVAEWLNKCGADIQGAGTTTIVIKGTAKRLLKATTYVTVPDRIEAGSFLLLGALCASDLVISDCRPDHMESVISLLKSSGVPIRTTKDQVIIEGNTLPIGSFKSFNIRTHEYPGFPTDIQSPLVTFLTQATGESVVLETIYEGRFKFTEELIKMGANITMMNPREILIKGPTPLSQLPEGDILSAHDIRAGFAVVMAALTGKGSFTVNNVHLIDRGYEKLEEKLRAIGAQIERKVA